MSKNALSCLFIQREISGGNKKDIHSLAKEMLDVPNSHSNTLLHRAALEGGKGADQGTQEFYKNVVQLGVSPYAKGKDGKMALELAVANRNLNLTKVLLEHSKEKANFQHVTIRKIFFDALACSDIELISFLIKAGVDVNLRFSDGETPLIKAINNRQLGICQLLIGNGADINLPNNDWHTPLMYAVQIGFINIYRFLLEHPKFLLESQDSSGSEVLFWAAGNGRTDICQLLIEKGADVNLVNGYGNTPLINAARYGHIDICQLLIDNGADINVQNHEGLTAFLYAEEGGDRAICDLITAATENNIPLNDNITQFEIECKVVGQEAQTLFYQSLVEQGLRPYTKNKDGKMALELAVTNRNFNLTKVLIECAKEKANFRYLTVTKTFLAALKDQNIELIKFLIEAGIDVNLRFVSGNTALMFAAVQGRVDICQLLINAGADVNVQMNDGGIALMFAAEQGDMDICQLLIEHPNYKPDIQNRNGDTAFMLAAKAGRADIFRLLLQKGVDINFQNNSGATAFMLAAKAGRADICRLSLEHPNYQPDIQNQSRDTALMFAAEQGYTDICQLLLEHPNYQPDIQNQNEDTALIVAAAHGHTDICRLLLEKGADINFQNNSGATALMWAAKEGRADICRLLIDGGAKSDLVMGKHFMFGDMLFKNLFLLCGGRAVKEFVYNKLGYTIENSTKIVLSEAKSDLMSSIYLIFYGAFVVAKYSGRAVKEFVYTTHLSRIAFYKWHGTRVLTYI